MGWTVFKQDCGQYWAINGVKCFKAWDHGGTWIEHTELGSIFPVKIKPKAYARTFPEEKRLTPAETRALFARVGTPDGKPKAKATHCDECGQPMLPRGVKKKPNEYDHARNCSKAKSRRKVITDTMRLNAVLKCAAWVHKGGHQIWCDNRREIDAAIRAMRSAKRRGK